jgi:hypothetical protein
MTSLPSRAALSAQTDRFVHDRLPPLEQRAAMRYELPELQIARQANLVDLKPACLALGQDHVELP